MKTWNVKGKDGKAVPTPEGFGRKGKKVVLQFENGNDAYRLMQALCIATGNVTPLPAGSNTGPLKVNFKNL